MTAENRHMPGSRRWRFWIGGGIIVLTMIYLILSSMQGTVVHAFTISELKARGPTVYGQAVRVSGTVDGSSILWNAGELVLRFNLVDGLELLPVTYKGARPDMLRDGAQALVEGKYQLTSVFEATKLLLKCPSKYEAAATMTATK